MLSTYRQTTVDLRYSCLCHLMLVTIHTIFPRRVEMIRNNDVRITVLFTDFFYLTCMLRLIALKVTRIQQTQKVNKQALLSVVDDLTHTISIQVTEHIYWLQTNCPTISIFSVTVSFYFNYCYQYQQKLTSPQSRRIELHVPYKQNVDYLRLQNQTYETNPRPG
jgi:hypothetical protein